MEHETEDQETRPPSRFGWGAGVIVAAAIIGVAANLVRPGSPWGIALFGVALLGLALFLRFDRDSDE